MTRTIELYSALRDKLGDAETRLLIDAIEESNDISTAGLVTKEDLAKAAGMLKEDMLKLEIKLSERIQLNYFTLSVHPDNPS